MTSGLEPGSAEGETAGTPPDPFIGLQIHSLIVKEPLASGGMGVV